MTVATFLSPWVAVTVAPGTRHAAEGDLSAMLRSRERTGQTEQGGERRTAQPA